MRSIHVLCFSIVTALLTLQGAKSVGGGVTAGTKTAPDVLVNMGQQITPLAPEGSQFVTLNPNLPDHRHQLAGQAVTTVVSPDRSTLLVLTSGFNRIFTASGAPSMKESNDMCCLRHHDSTPRKKQVLQIPNSYTGIVSDPSGKAFYGGAWMTISTPSRWTMGLEEAAPAIALGHHRLGNGLAGDG